MAFRSIQSLFQALSKKTSYLPGSSLAKSTNAPLVLRTGAASSQSLITHLSTQWQPLVCSQWPTTRGTAGYFHQPQRNYHFLTQFAKSILPLHATDLSTQIRTVTKFSMRKGRRKTVKAVIHRFYRLDWGIWIRPKSGRHRKLWKKGKLRRKRLRQHVFTNAWQTRTLDRMTTKYWHKKKYWVDDPYEPYHKRDNFWITKNTKNIVHQLD